MERIRFSKAMSQTFKSVKKKLWNEINLPAPNGDFCSYDINDIEMIVSISNLVSELSNAAVQIGADHPVWNETKVFLALQERTALKLPCDKFLHILKMVGHCLRNFVLMKLFQKYLDLAERFLQGIQNATEAINLPSRQQLEYLLIRTQGAAKLILKTISYLEETFVYLIQRMKIGHLIPSLLMVCSEIGRIRITYKALLLQICEVYKQIKPWLSCLKIGIWQWPYEPKLPEDLWKWLKPEDFEVNSQKFLGRSKDNVPFLNSFFKSNDNETKYENEVTILDENEITILDENEVTILDENNKDNETCDIINVDIGEIQPRTTFVESDNIFSTPKQAVNDAENVDEESPLLNAIEEAKSVKEIIFILKLLCAKKQKMLKEIFQFRLSENSCKKLNKMFLQLKLDFANSKNQNNRGSYRKKLLKKTKVKLYALFHHKGKHRNKKGKTDKEKLIDHEMEIVNISPTTDELIPVRTLPKLRKLFNTIKSKTDMPSDKLLLLTKAFKGRRKNIKLLVNNGDIRLARKLIFNTSVKLIRVYKEIL